MQKFWFGAAAVLAGVAVLAGCGRKDANALRLGTDAKFPPFEMRGGATGTDVVGFDVDVAQAIAANAGKKLKIVEMDGARLLPALADGQVDFVMAALAPGRTVSAGEGAAAGEPVPGLVPPAPSVPAPLLPLG